MTIRDAEQKKISIKDTLKPLSQIFATIVNFVQTYVALHALMEHEFDTDLGWDNVAAWFYYGGGIGVATVVYVITTFLYKQTSQSDLHRTVEIGTGLTYGSVSDLSNEQKGETTAINARYQPTGFFDSCVHGLALSAVLLTQVILAFTAIATWISVTPFELSFDDAANSLGCSLLLLLYTGVSGSAFYWNLKYNLNEYHKHRNQFLNTSVKFSELGILKQVFAIWYTTAIVSSSAFYSRFLLKTLVEKSLNRTIYFSSYELSEDTSGLVVLEAIIMIIVALSATFTFALSFLNHFIFVGTISETSSQQRVVYDTLGSLKQCQLSYRNIFALTVSVFDMGFMSLANIAATQSFYRDYIKDYDNLGIAKQLSLVLATYLLINLGQVMRLFCYRLVKLFSNHWQLPCVRSSDTSWELNASAISLDSDEQEGHLSLAL